MQVEGSNNSSLELVVGEAVVAVTVLVEVDILSKHMLLTRAIQGEDHSMPSGDKSLNRTMMLY